MKYREKLGFITLGGFLMLVGMLAASWLSPLGAQNEEVFFAVIGGAAVMTLVVGSFALPGAEDEPLDLNAGKIKCRELEVVGELGVG